MIVTGNCKDCGYDTIQATICEINKQLAQTGSIKYNNTAYHLTDKFNVERWEALVLYRSILERKLFDPTYTDFPTSTIISKSKEYING